MDLNSSNVTELPKMQLSCLLRCIECTTYVMRPIATAASVQWCVCHAAALCKTVERIDVLFGVETYGKPRWWSRFLYGAEDSMRPLPNYFGFCYNYVLINMFVFAL